MMKHFTHKSPAADNKYPKLAMLATALFSMPLLNGCAIKPYVVTAGLQTTLPPQPQIAYAGDIAKAIDDVDRQRTAYLDALDSRTNTRNLLNGGLIVLTAGAIYKGVANISNSTNGIVAKAGALAGAGYALNSYSDSPATEQAYLQGHRNLTCMVLRTRPWLMTVTEYEGLFGQPSVALTTSPTTAAGSPTTLSGNVSPTTAVLRERIDHLDKQYEVAIAEVGNAREKAFLRETRDISSALYNARKTYRSAQHLKGYVDTAGFQLRQEANIVVSLTDQAIQKAQPVAWNPQTQLGTLQGISAAFQKIKPVDLTTTSDEKDDVKTGVDGDMTATQPSDSDTNKGKAGTGGTPVAESSASSPAGKAADRTDQRVKTLQAKVKKLEKTKVSPADAGSGASTKTMVDLAGKKSDLYAAMRPVTAVLTRVYALKPFVKDVTQCRGEQAQLLKLMPDVEEVVIAPGASYELTITGGTGYPNATLGGQVATGAEKVQVKLQTTLADGVAKTRVTVPAEMQSGEFTLQVRDGDGTQSDAVHFVVKAGK